MLKGDFHIHTTYSIDGTMSPEALIEACIEQNINCIAVTDHDTVDGAYRVKQLAPFKVIIGEEISSSDGHIIGLFLKDVIPSGLSAEVTVSRIKAQGGIAIAPHPFSRLAGRDSLGDVLESDPALFDVIEVANSNNLIRSDDDRALDFATTYAIPSIGGSDAHHVSGIGSNIVTLPDFNCPASFLKSLAEATISNRIHPAHYFAKLALTQVSFRMKYGLHAPLNGADPVLHS